MKAWQMGLLMGTIVGTTVMAQSKTTWKLGGSAGYSVGGDLEENNFVPGVHASWCRESSGLFVDLSWARVEDGMREDVGGATMDAELEVDELVAALGMILPMSPKTTLDAVVGVGYYDPTFSVAIDPSNIGTESGVPGLRADFDVDAEMDPAFGAVIGMGITFKAAESLDLFADYRYHAVEFDATLKGTVKLAQGNRSETIEVRENLEGTFNHGILRVGASLRF